MQCVRIKREHVAIYWDGSIRLEVGVFAEDGEGRPYSGPGAA
jgi:hypothetical protein